MDYNAIADAIAYRCRLETGINALDYVPDSLPSAAMYVGEIDVELDGTFRRGGRRGTDQATITLRILVARSTDKYALRKLREYMSSPGPASIIDALAKWRALPGEDDVPTVHDSQCKRMRGNRLFTVGEQRFYGVEIDLFVIGDAG